MSLDMLHLEHIFGFLSSMCLAIILLYMACTGTAKQILRCIECITCLAKFQTKFLHQEILK